MQTPRPGALPFSSAFIKVSVMIGPSKEERREVRGKQRYKKIQQEEVVVARLSQEKTNNRNALCNDTSFKFTSSGAWTQNEFPNDGYSAFRHRDCFLEGSWGLLEAFRARKLDNWVYDEILILHPSGGNTRFPCTCSVLSIGPDLHG